MGIFKRFWHGWKAVARKIGDFQARVILALFYFLILSPFSLIMWAKDPLAINGRSQKGWHLREKDDTKPMDRAYQQW